MAPRQPLATAIGFACCAGCGAIARCCCHAAGTAALPGAGAGAVRYGDG
jgi:hypothetical protein